MPATVRLVHVEQHRGLKVVALRVQTFAAAKRTCSRERASVEVFFSRRPLPRRNEAGRAGSPLCWIADDELFRRIDESLDERFVNAALDELPASRAAILALCWQNTLIGEVSAARSQSASAKTMFGDLPPSSREIRFISRDANSMIRRPISVEPVKEIFRISGCVTSASPMADPRRAAPARPLPGGPHRGPIRPASAR